MGGFVATVLRDKLTAKRKAQEPPPEPAKAFLMRWLTHISASVFIAPGLTFHYHHNFPEIPVETFALAVGGLTGVAAQAVLLIAIPTIILWALRKFLPNANDLLPPKDS